MSQFFAIHPDNPQPRLIKQAVEIIRKGGLVAYPTDSCYALGCRLGDKEPLERIRKIRQADERHNFTLMCPDLSAIANYAQVENSIYRLLKAHTPGPFTFILPASKKVPRNAWSKRKNIGIRVPENQIVHDLLTELGEPILSSTLILPGDELPLTDAWSIREELEHSVDLIIDGEHCGIEMTTVIDLTGSEPELIRQGRGDASGLLG